MSDFPPIAAVPQSEISDLKSQIPPSLVVPLAEQPPVAIQPVTEAEIVQLDVAADRVMSEWMQRPRSSVATDDATDASRNWYSLPLQRGRLVALLVSLALHVWLLSNLDQLVVQGAATFRESMGMDYSVDSVEIAESPMIEMKKVDYELQRPDGNESDSEFLNSASVGLLKSATPKFDAQPRFVAEVVATPIAATAVYDIPEGAEVDNRVLVNGTNGPSLVQLESAMDLVTWEIAKNLQEQRVLVVWLLDASASLDKQKQTVASRLKRVYTQLDALQNTEQLPKHEIPVLSAVVTFGQKTTFITPTPTDNLDEIVNGVLNAPTDPSGVENIFGAVSQVLQTWQNFRTVQQRRILLVTLTDEAGDDFSEQLEKSIVQCQKFGAKAYVLGPAAVFGRRDGFMPYVAPEDGKTYKLPIAIGPEVPVFEALDLPFWYDGPQYTYLSSGFAPYALARLVHETGGVYFMTNMTTMSGLTPIGTYDPAVLKPFQPDYSFGTIEAYERDLKKHPIRMAVVNAAALSRKFTAKGTPTLDLRVTAANYKTAAGDAQKSVAESQLMVDLLSPAFPESIEKQLDREPSARWRMNFCLSYGRVLAHKVRCQEYNLAFAWIKNELSAEDINKKSNHWIVRPDRTLNYSGNLRKTALKAEELLTRVTKEAPGTPFAVLAERELKDGFGIKIEQRFIPPPPPAPPQAAAPPAKRVLFAAEEAKKKPAPPKPPPPPKPVLPKL